MVFRTWAHERAPLNLQWYLRTVTPISTIVGLCSKKGCDNWALAVLARAFASFLVVFLVNNSLSGRWLFLASRLTIVSLDT